MRTNNVVLLMLMAICSNTICIIARADAIPEPYAFGDDGIEFMGVGDYTNDIPPFVYEDLENDEDAAAAVAAVAAMAADAGGSDSDGNGNANGDSLAIMPPEQKRACVRRSGNCDHRPNDCCNKSSCRCNLWGSNCRCQRQGLFQRWG